MADMRIRIQKTIRALILAGEVFEVSYDHDQVPTQTSTPYPRPPSVIANEYQSLYEGDRRNGRSLETTRSGWKFIALAEWPDEVSIEALEEALAHAPVADRSVQDDTGRHAIIMYNGCRIQHPATSKASKGTRLELDFTVLVQRA